MINPLAVEEFLNRQLVDLSRVKNLDESTLDEKISQETNNFQFSIKLKKHQKAGVLTALRRIYCMFLFDMGLGKSATSLALIEYYKHIGAINRTLILVPNISNLFSWEEQVKTHTPNLSVELLFDDKENRQDVMESSSDILVATYAGWNSFVCSKEYVSKKKNKLVLDNKKAKYFTSKFQAVVYDEITASKNHQSLTFKTCKYLSRFIEYRYGLTGTPFGNDPQDLWSQYYLIDKGETLGTTLGIYRAAFFKEQEDYWKGTIYVFDKKKDEILNKTLMNSSLRYKTEECLDLPEKVYIKKPYKLTAEQWQYYNAGMQKIRDAEGNPFEINKSWHNLRTICSGWVGAVDDENEKLSIEFSENPKLELLFDCINELNGEKVVCFNHYITTGNIIEREFKKMGIGYVRLYSGTTHKDQVQEKFNKDAKIQVFLSSSSGMVGLNLQIARYMFMLESPTAPDRRDQAEKRIHRIGQGKTCFFGDLLGRGTVEERILKAIADGEDLKNRIVDGGIKL